MGSLFKPKQPAPPPPAPPSERDILAARIRAEKDVMLENAVEQSLNEISRLSVKDYKADKNTRRVLKEWADRQAELLEQHERRKFMRFFQGE
jgi:hypothetical protein